MGGWGDFFADFARGLNATLPPAIVRSNEARRRAIERRQYLEEERDIRRSDVEYAEARKKASQAEEIKSLNPILKYYRGEAEAPTSEQLSGLAPSEALSFTRGERDVQKEERKLRQQKEKERTEADAFATAFKSQFPDSPVKEEHLRSLAPKDRESLFKLMDKEDIKDFKEKVQSQLQEYRTGEQARKWDELGARLKNIESKIEKRGADITRDKDLLDIRRDLATFSKEHTTRGDALRDRIENRMDRIENRMQGREPYVRENLEARTEKALRAPAGGAERPYRSETQLREDAEKSLRAELGVDRYHVFTPEQRALIPQLVELNRAGKAYSLKEREIPDEKQGAIHRGIFGQRTRKQPFLEVIEDLPGGRPKTISTAPPKQGPTKPSAPQPSIKEGQTATNPETGKKLIYRNGQWVPYAP